MLTVIIVCHLSSYGKPGKKPTQFIGKVEPRFQYVPVFFELSGITNQGMYIGVIFVTAIRAVHVESRIFTTGVGYCSMVYIPTAILHGSGIMAVFNAGAYVDRSTQIFRNVEIQIRPEVISVEVGDIVSFEWRILIKKTAGNEITHRFGTPPHIHIVLLLYGTGFHNLIHPIHVRVGIRRNFRPILH